MYCKEDLVSHIRNLGIHPGDTVMVHTALKSVGSIDPGDKTTAEVFLDALRECVGDGLLLIPAHTWGNVREDGQVCDLRRTVPCIGAVPTVAVELAAKAWKEGRRDCLRSPHPTHSVVAFGPEAAAYTGDDAFATTPTPWNGSFGKLYARGGKILLVGVDHGRNTFFHAVDEWLDIPNRLCEHMTQLSLRDYNGELKKRPVYRHARSMSDFFMNYEPYLEQMGAVQYGRIGDALTRVCDARACAEAVRRLWQHADRDLCEKKECLNLEKLLGSR